MRMVFGFLLLLAPVFADGVPREEYQARRTQLRKSLDGVLVLFARADDDLRDYVQEPNFLYLTGWHDPGAVLMMTADEEILFLPPRSKTAEIFLWAGHGPERQRCVREDGISGGAAEVGDRDYVFAADREGSEDLWCAGRYTAGETERSSRRFMKIWAMLRL